MTSLAALFVRQNEWANLQMIEACRDLTDEQLHATTDGVFGSIHETFRHVLGSELYYATLLGQDVETWDRDTDPSPSWDDFADMARRAADALVAATEGETDRRVRSSSGNWDIDASVVIVQAVHHGTDHRSQINTLLTTLGRDPVEISSWSWGEDTGKMHPVED